MSKIFDFVKPGVIDMSKIFDFVKPGVITGDDVQKVFQVAKENNFALPAVNCVGTDSINAVLETAAKVKAPVIVQFSNGGASFIAGKGVKSDVPQGAAILGAISGAHHVHQMAEHYGVPVILHTDHCAKKLLPWIDGLLDAGEKHFAATGKPLFSSHMIDLSEESLQENIEICSKYLERMSKIGMTLEIELGCTGGEGAISGAHHVHQMAEHYGVPVILHTDHCAKKLLPWIDGLLDAGEKHFAALVRITFTRWLNIMVFRLSCTPTTARRNCCRGSTVCWTRVKNTSLLPVSRCSLLT